MARLWVGTVPLAFALSSCHSTQAPVVAPASTHNAGSATPTASVAERRVEPRRPPSQSIVRRWAAPAAPLGLGFADLGALFDTPLAKGLMPSAMVAAQRYLAKDATDCAAEWSAAIREVAGAFDEKDFLIVLSYDASRLGHTVDYCVQAFGARPRIDLPNADAAYELERGVVAFSSGTAVFGSRVLVEASLAGGNIAAFPDNLTLGTDQQLTLSGRADDNLVDYRASLSVTDNQFAIHVDAAYPNLERAREAEAMVAPAHLRERLKAESLEAKAVLGQVLDLWHVQRDERTVTFELRTSGTVTQMAERIGLFAAMAVHGVRRYVQNAKVVLARKTVGAIAEQLRLSNAKKFAALPAVPRSLDSVRGKSYQSAPSDWQTWKSIEFSIDKPQYYQFRVEVAKDKKSGQVIAEGDLDGNGKHSLFWVDVTLDPKSHLLDYDPVVKERDPFE